MHFTGEGEISCRDRTDINFTERDNTSFRVRRGHKISYQDREDMKFAKDA